MRTAAAGLALFAACEISDPLDAWSTAADSWMLYMSCAMKVRVNRGSAECEDQPAQTAYCGERGV